MSNTKHEFDMFDMRCEHCRASYFTLTDQEKDGSCPAQIAREKRNRRARQNRRALKEAYESVGLTRVRVNGRTYWE